MLLSGPGGLYYKSARASASNQHHGDGVAEEQQLSQGGQHKHRQCPGVKQVGFLHQGRVPNSSATSTERDAGGTDHVGAAAVEVPPPTALRVEGLLEVDALGVDTLSPLLQWRAGVTSVTTGSPRGLKQASFQAQVLDAVTGTLLWDSDVVASAVSKVVYGGSPLQEAGAFRWRVQAWYATLPPAQPLVASGWSNYSNFTTGLVSLASWRGATWIQGGPYLRASVPVPNAACASPGTAPLNISRATAFVSGLGWYVLYVNGVRVGDRQLDVGWTRYERRVLYSTLDVTSLLCSGVTHRDRESDTGSLLLNLGVELGGGHFNPNWYEPSAPFVGQLLLQLHITYVDGSIATFGSGDGVTAWATSSDGPILGACVYGGQSTDLTRGGPSSWHTWAWAPAVWSPPLGSGSTGTPCTTLGCTNLSAQLNGSALVSQTMPPIRERTTLLPIGVYYPTTTSPAAQPAEHQGLGLSCNVSGPDVVFDFGQNFAGWVRVTISGTAPPCSDGGLAVFTLTVTHAEILFWNNLTLNPFTLGAAANTDVYTFAVNASAPVANLTLEPSFTYHGFRFAQLSGLPAWAAVSVDTAVGVVLSSDLNAVGSWGFGDDVATRVAGSTWWSQVSALYSIPTDCPQRDERLGWVADAHMSMLGSTRTFNGQAFYRHFIMSLIASQDAQGSVPDFVPDCDAEDGAVISSCDPSYTRPADPGWGTGLVSMVARHFQTYGDDRLVALAYPNLRLYIYDMLGRLTTNGLLDLSEFGDWNGPWTQGGGGPVTTDVVKVDGIIVSSTWLYRDLLLVADMATLVGQAADSAKFKAVAAQLASDFNSARWNSSTGTYMTGTGYQAANSLPLLAGIAAAGGSSLAQAALSSLVSTFVVGEPVAGSAPLGAMHISSGIFGTDASLQVLVSGGGGVAPSRTDLALEAVRTPSFPSFANMTSPSGNGTTLWENWQEVLSPAPMNEGASQNHIMFGTVFNFLFTTVAGLSGEDVLTTTGQAGWASPLCAPDPYLLWGLPNSDSHHKSGSPYSVATPVRYASAAVTDISDGVACGWAVHLPQGSGGGLPAYNQSIAQVNVTVPVEATQTGTTCVPLPPVGPGTGFVVTEAGVGALVWSSTGGCAATPASSGILGCRQSTYSFVSMSGNGTDMEHVGDIACFSLSSGAYSFTVVPAAMPEPAPALAVVCASGGVTNDTAAPGVTLDCTATLGPGAVVSSVHFASFGTPQGVCGGYTFHQCHAPGSRAAVEAMCVGAAACTLPTDLPSLLTMFGEPTPCQLHRGFVDTGRLQVVVQAACVRP